MLKERDAFRQVQLYAKVLAAYNRVLEQTIEDRLISEKDKSLLQKIYRKLEEVSVLVDELKENT